MKQTRRCWRTRLRLARRRRIGRGGLNGEGDIRGNGLCADSSPGPVITGMTVALALRRRFHDATRRRRSGVCATRIASRRLARPRTRLRKKRQARSRRIDGVTFCCNFPRGVVWGERKLVQASPTVGCAVQFVPSLWPLATGRSACYLIPKQHRCLTRPFPARLHFRAPARFALFDTMQ
jgi:hypothetical protein